MKKYFFGILLILQTLQMGCTGSGAVNPITPKNSSQPDSATAADSDVIYWTSFPVTFTLTDPLNGVYLISKKLGWACGNNGVVLQYDGDTWSKVDTGLAKNENLTAVAFANENEGWMVGSHGTILHYNNGNWNLDDSQTQDNLFGVAVTRSRTVWVVGANGTILTYNGVSWGKILSQTTGSLPTTVTEDLYGVGLSDQNNGWVVGNRGTLLRYDGQKWMPFTASPSTEKLNSISVISNVQAWAVGAFGTILNFNGTTWNKQGSAASGADLYQVFMKNDSDGWASGQDGTLIFYDGSRWISHAKPLEKPSLNSISFFKDLGFAVGSNGSILKFQPNGELAKMSFLFKGEVTKKPAKPNLYWTITYTLMNQSPKISPFLVYEVPLPKGFEPYQPKDTPTPGPSSVGTVSAVSPTPTATLTVKTPGIPGLGTPTPGSQNTTRSATSVSGAWKVNGNNLDWEIGTVAASELKTLTVLLQEKKNEKKEFPILLKAVLKAGDKVMAEASPVTMMVTEKPIVPPATSPLAKRTPPTLKSTPAPSPVSTQPSSADSTTQGAPVQAGVPQTNPLGGGTSTTVPTPSAASKSSP